MKTTKQTKTWQHLMDAHAVQQELNSLEIADLIQATGYSDAVYVSLEGDAMTDYHLAIRNSYGDLLGCFRD